MYLSISADGVALHQPESLRELYASYTQRLTAPKIDEVLTEDGVGTMLPDGAHVMVRVDALRRLAAGRVGEDWEDGFAGMLEQARERGWLSDDGEAVRAHLEREL